MTNFLYSGSKNIIINNSRLLCLKVIPFIPTWVSPNMITFFGNIPYLYTYNFKCSYILLLITHLLQWFCDDLDGIYAREKNKTSQIGAFYDHVFDSIWTNTFTFFFISEILGDNNSILWLLSITFKFITYLNKRMIGHLIVPDDIDIFRFVGGIYLLTKVLIPSLFIPLNLKKVIYYFLLLRFSYNNLNIIYHIYKNKINKNILIKNILSYLCIITIFKINENCSLSNNSMFKLGQAISILEFYNISNAEDDIFFVFCLLGSVIILFNNNYINLIIQFIYFFILTISF